MNLDPKRASSAEVGHKKPPPVLDFRAVSEPRWSPRGTRLGWLEEVEGSTRFFFLNLAPDLLIGAPQSVGARVRRTPPTYGGAWAWRGDTSVVVVASDNRVLLLNLENGEERVLIDDALSAVTSRYLAPAVSLDGRWLAVTREQRDAMEIVVLPIDASLNVGEAFEAHVVPSVISNADFAWDPVWSPDTELLAWHEWSNPDMPWDASRIVVVDFHDGVAKNKRIIAGGDDEQVGQPRFSPDGTRLAWLTDIDGWLRVCVGNRDGANSELLSDAFSEAGEAPWGAGQRSYAWSPDSKCIAWCHNESGFGRLVCAEVGADKSIGEPVREIAKAWHHGVSWGPHGVAAIRSGARTPPRVVLYPGVLYPGVLYPGVLYPNLADASSAGMGFGERIEIADGDPIGFDKDTFAEGCLVEPEILSWMAGEVEITGLLYLPPNVEHPPLILDLHGGPTGAATARWSPNVAALLSHGWGVLRPNPRGSYGSGRDHLRALDGGWGALDFDDVIAGIEAVSRAPDVDASRIAVTGGSAGGMLALLIALLRPDLVKACISVYGVTDLFSLADTDYRFEKHYAKKLVGELPEAHDLYVERSPITHAHRLSVPTLMLHGDADEVVPVAQMRDFVAAARAGGADIESHEYAGEGHGWSKPETVRDDFERTVTFLEKWL